MTAAIVVVVLSGLTLMAGAVAFGDPWSVAVTALATALLSLPPYWLIERRMQRAADDKLTGGRAADRAFFIRELRERDLIQAQVMKDRDHDYLRAIKALSYDAGAAEARLAMTAAKVQAMTHRPRDARNRFIAASAEPTSDPRC